MTKPSSYNTLQDDDDGEVYECDACFDVYTEAEDAKRCCNDA